MDLQMGVSRVCQWDGENWRKVNQWEEWDKGSWMDARENDDGKRGTSLFISLLCGDRSISDVRCFLSSYRDRYVPWVDGTILAFSLRDHRHALSIRLKHSARSSSSRGEQWKWTIAHSHRQRWGMKRPQQGDTSYRYLRKCCVFDSRRVPRSVIHSSIETGTRLLINDCSFKFG